MITITFNTRSRDRLKTLIGIETTTRRSRLMVASSRDRLKTLIGIETFKLLSVGTFPRGRDRLKTLIGIETLKPKSKTEETFLSRSA